MDTAITGLIIITVLLLAVMGLYEHYFSAQDTILESWRELEERTEEKSRTDLSVAGTEVPLFSSGNTVNITVKNDGDTKLADFEQWDVILQYTGTDGDHAAWYPYGSGLNEWTSIIDDLFEPGILNPGEEMMIQVSVLPPVASPTTNVATIATPNGITVSAVFTYSVP
jgi:archaellum component FlaF (FlaF/FlaG flagellin family)